MVKMSVDPTIPKEIDHSTCGLRFLGLEADLKNLSQQFNEVKTKLV